MSQIDHTQFLEIYQKHRYDNQCAFYETRRKSFDTSITIIVWLRLSLLLLAAILPVLSTAMAGYSALYAFEQQAKLYQDTLINLHYVRALNPNLKPGLDMPEFERELNKYVEEVEKILVAEQGQWGQLAKSMKVSDT